MVLSCTVCGDWEHCARRCPQRSRRLSMSSSSARSVLSPPFGPSSPSSPVTTPSSRAKRTVTFDDCPDVKVIPTEKAPRLRPTESILDSFMDDDVILPPCLTASQCNSGGSGAQRYLTTHDSDFDCLSAASFDSASTSVPSSSPSTPESSPRSRPRRNTMQKLIGKISAVGRLRRNSGSKKDCAAAVDINDLDIEL